MIRVVVCDDHKMLLDGISQFLGEQKGIEIIATFPSVEETLVYLEENTTDVLLTDISFPDRDGFDLQEEIHVKYPDIKTVFLSMHDKSSYIKKAIRSGARGYLLKESPISKIADLIEGYMQVKRYFQKWRWIKYLTLT